MGRQPSHLTRSPLLLRAAATIVTVGTLLGSTAFAAGHVYNPAAPFTPARMTTSATTPNTWVGGDGRDQDDTPPAARTVPRTTVTSGVGATTRPAQTRTGQS